MNIIRFIKKNYILLTIVLLFIFVGKSNLKNIETFKMKEDMDDLYNHHVCSKVPPFPELSMFANNLTSPDCCMAGGYTSINGCICMCQEQVDYIRNRGGNKNDSSYY